MDSFSSLWKRRVKMRLPGLGRVAVLALPDLVKAKKTQRDKDWPMLRRLIEADILGKRAKPSAKNIRFWLQECRSPDLLIDLTRRYPAEARRAARKRRASAEAIKGRKRGLPPLSGKKRTVSATSTAGTGHRFNANWSNGA